MGKVSVALATYNCSRYIEAALESLLDQEDLDEICVSDDRSTDGTAEIIRQFSGPKLKVSLHDKNVGQGANFNRAIRECTGEFIQFFCQDDIARPGFVASQAAVMARDPRIGLVYSSCNLIDESGQKIGVSDDDGTPALVDFPTYLKISGRHGSLPPSTSSVMIRREAIERAGMLDERLIASGDLEFFNRVAEQFWFARNRSRLLDVRSHRGSVTMDAETPKRYMTEEVELLKFYRRHLDDVEYRKMMNYRARHRGADHAKYILKALAAGRLSDARTAYKALSQVHNVPLCVLHAVLQKIMPRQAGR